MAETRTALAEQFDDLSQQQDASILGMWTFLATEMLFFGGLFMSYIVYRSTYPDAFAAASKHTIVLYGTVNTAILLTSSLTMALGVRAAQMGDNRWVSRFLKLTVLLGVGFLAVKGLEYRQDLQEHLLPGRTFRTDLPRPAELFWFLYWVMTGLHALHVLIGICLISVIAILAPRWRFSAEYHNPVEVSGLYWHFVDIVWIFLYPLLYLVDRYS